ncbi:MAG: ABC transporter ATP-binding protein [Actinomycetota bacterium]
MGTLQFDLTVPVRSFDVEVALDVGRETVALVGPSGAGKTTLLRALAGLTRPSRGRIEVDGETWLDGKRSLRPEARSVGYVFQEYALFPHLTVERNVSFGAAAHPYLLERFGLAGLRKAKPGQLSGGEKQRVALARALAREPKVLLLDEPLAALDAHTRGRVRAELAGHLREAGLPTILVTHDFMDAAALGNRIGVLVDGKIVQMGTATELIAAPESSFVAEFAGSNLLHGIGRPGRGGLSEVALEDGTTFLSSDVGTGPVGLVVHPWDISVARALADDSAQNHLSGTITSMIPLGNRMRVTVGPLTAEITAASAEQLRLAVGETVVASFKATATRLMPGG